MDRMTARGIIYHEGKFLLVRIKAYPDFWCLPGGGIDPGEDVASAMTRELIEETGVTPKIGKLLYVHQIKRTSGYGAPEFFFHIMNGKDYLGLDLASTTHGELELAEADFKAITDVFVLPNFLKNELPELAKNKFNTPTRFRLSSLTND